MKKFKFRLERVLNYREAIKTEKKTELAKKNAKLAEEEQRLEMLEEAFLNNEAIIDSSNASATSADMIRMAGMYAARLKNEIEKQHASIANVKKAVEVARLAYIEAAKEAVTIKNISLKRMKSF
ncbi:MAG: flagellar export protein FliJ [Bdellovibrionota bacterium]